MGTQFWVKWGPNGDPRQQKWGPKNVYFKIDWNKQIHWRSKFFLNKKYSQRQSVSSFSAQCLCHLHWIIKWSTLDGGCTEFSRVLKPELEKMGTLKKNGDPMGTQNLKKVPMGTRVPKWGPTWEQCILSLKNAKAIVTRLWMTTKLKPCGMVEQEDMPMAISVPTGLLVCRINVPSQALFPHLCRLWKRHFEGRLNRTWPKILLVPSLI